MIKTIVSIAALTLLLISCSSEESDKNIHETLEEEATSKKGTKSENDGMDTESIVKEEEEEEEIFDYSKIEHYAVFDTKSRLLENFGAENIEDGSTWYGEGSIELQHSVLTNPNNGSIIKYVWSEENPEKLSLIEVRYYRYDDELNVIGNQVLGTDCGISTGMSINDLHTWYGKEVQFSGFGWDFGGQIMNTEGTKFATCNASIQLGLNDGVSEDIFNKFSGDSEFSSANPDVQSAGIVVTDITYFISE